VEDRSKPVWLEGTCVAGRDGHQPYMDGVYIPIMVETIRYPLPQAGTLHF